MLINKDSVTINGLSIGTYVTQVKLGHNKLWGSDTGRNLAGTYSGTLIGIFPKLICSFRKMTKAEIEVIAPILDSETQTVVYYDPSLKRNVTMSTYTGDWEETQKGLEKLESFDCSFISRRRRT